MKILFIRFSSIGDLVLTTPLYRCVKSQIPNAEIHLVTKRGYAHVLSANGNLDKIWGYKEEDAVALVAQLKGEKFDYVADLHHNLRSLRIKKALAVKETHSFPKLNVEKWVQTALKINVLPPGSIVDRYFKTLKNLGVHNDGQGLDYTIPPAGITKSEDLPMGHLAGFVACVIGGSYATKQLPAEQWRAFAAGIDLPLVLLGGPEDREMGQEICKGDNGQIYNACGKFSLAESADLVQRSRVVVANDTGLMHVAAAFKKPIVSLWGNTVPQFGMFPYYGFNDLENRIAPQCVIIERKSLWCRPCSKLGFGRCPLGHFKCMKTLDMLAVQEAVIQLWAADKARKKG